MNVGYKKIVVSTLCRQFLYVSKDALVRGHF